MGILRRAWERLGDIFLAKDLAAWIWRGAVLLAGAGIGVSLLAVAWLAVIVLCAVMLLAAVAAWVFTGRNRARIVNLDLAAADWPSLRLLREISTSSPVVYGLRWFYVMNKGADTVLTNWAIWVRLPRLEPVKAIVLSRNEGPLVDPFVSIVPGADVVMAGAVVRAKPREPVFGVIPFKVHGLEVRDLDNPGVIVEVRYVDDFGVKHRFGIGTMKRRM